MDELDEFPESGRVGPLNLADIQRCVLHAMERVHFDKETTELPGHPGRTVMKASAVLVAYEARKSRAMLYLPMQCIIIEIPIEM